MSLTSKEKVFAALELRKCGEIPVLPVMIQMIPFQSGVDRAEYEASTELFVDCALKMRKKYGYDWNSAAEYDGASAFMASELIDKNGNVSPNGDMTIRTEADLDLMKPYDIEADENLKIICERIRLLKEAEPDVPVMTIFINPVSASVALMDGANFYLSLIRNKRFIQKTIEKVMEPTVQAMQRIVEAGCDILWIPMPTLGGTCMSRKHYEAVCHPVHKEFIKEARKTGAKIIYHTCGDWNDRFDLVLQEGVDGWHTTLADLSELKTTYGDKVCLMGQVPSAFTMLMKSEQEVYDESLSDCLIGAKGGGFILSPDCGLPPTIPAENIDAMMKAARDAQVKLGDDC